MIGTAEQLPRSRQQFVLRRLHSATGIFPIGAYLLVHIFLENTFVLAGGKSFEGLVRGIATIPGQVLLATEIVFIWAPLLFHSAYGFVRVGQSELENPLRNDYLGGHLYTLQRVSGVIAFLFIGWHVWSTRLQYYLFHTEITYAYMHDIMTDPVRFAAYLVGVLACVFHFTNGIWTFAITWGITVGQRAQRRLRTVCLVFFVFMYGTAVAILLAFRTGA
jgi:succinate dehydrogenase / fumarate reductase cytochrome b subunit